jgi:ubiquinone/menaquinone biosynthesis C-methylase UbiE
VKDYFDVHRGDWDGIYSARAGSLQWRINQRFRRAVWRRMLVTLEACSPIEGRSVLDIGCGTGELGLRLAAGGASRVLGIDRAGEMVRTAAGHAVTRNLSNVCAFVEGEFVTHDFGGETFSYTAALGVLDYVEDSNAFLDRMWALTRERLVVSLPQSVPPRSWLRRAWHGIHSSRLFYYDRRAVDAKIARLSPVDSEVQTLPGSDHTYVMICDRRPRAGGG